MKLSGLKSYGSQGEKLLKATFQDWKGSIKAVAFQDTAKRLSAELVLGKVFTYKKCISYNFFLLILVYLLCQSINVAVYVHTAKYS